MYKHLVNRRSNLLLSLVFVSLITLDNSDNELSDNIDIRSITSSSNSIFDYINLNIILVLYICMTFNIL
jgi:hypothetical protein